MHTLLRQHLLASVAICYILGIVFSRHIELKLDIQLIYPLAAISIAILYQYRRGYFQTALASALLLVCCTGLYSGTLSSLLPSSTNHIYNIVKDSTDAVIVGRLQSMPSYNGTSSQAKIDLVSISAIHDKSFRSAEGLILLRLRNSWPKEYQPGDLLAIRAALTRPSSFKTPGTFDYPRWLARKGIWINGYVRSPAQIQKVGPEQSLVRTIQFMPENIRTQIGYYLDNTLNADLSSIYRALLLGDRSRIPEQILEQFKGTGTMHILAISGIHVSILATLLFVILYWLLRRSEWLMLNTNVKKIAGILCIPLIISYSLLAGLNNPVVRASIISTIIILIFFSNRAKTISSLIAIASLIILGYSPQALFTASFQLSFAAFTSILVIIPLIRKDVDNSELSTTIAQRWLRNFNRWAVACLIASTAAIVGTTPILVYHFHRFPLLGPFTNLLVEPLICLWALPCGLLSLPVMFFWPEMANLLLNTGGIGLQISLWLTGKLYLLPYSSAWSPSPGTILLSWYYGSLILLAISWTRQRLASYCLVPIFLSSFMVMLYAPRTTLKEHIPTTTVHILDVGQGSATVIQLDSDKTILIDGGGSSYSRPSVGERVIAPFLWSLGITHLDTVVITHPDADHYNGIPFLIEHFSPQQIWTSSLNDNNPEYRSLLKLAAENDIDVILAEAGHLIQGNDSTIHCLINAKKHRKTQADRNAGLVIQLKTPTTSYLFPGDIHSETEAYLLEQNLSLKSTFLLASHHGSSTSNSAQFVGNVDPQLIIASAARYRTDKFPSQNLVELCKYKQIPLMVTAQHGTITFRESNNQVMMDRQEWENTNPLRRNREKPISAQLKGFDKETNDRVITLQ